MSLPDVQRGGDGMKIMKYLKKYIFLMVISLILSVGMVYAQIKLPLFIGQGIDCIIGPGNIDRRGLVLAVTSIAGYVICIVFLQLVINLVNNRITQGVVKDIRIKGFKALSKLPLKYIDSHQAGDIVSRLTSDIDQFSDGLLMGFSQLFTGVLTILGTIVFMFTIDVRISIMVIVLTPLSLFTASFIAKRTHRFFVDQSVKRGSLTGYIDEMIGQEKVVQAFSYEERAVERFEKLNAELTESSFKATFYSSLVNPSTRFVNNLIYAAVAIVGAFMVLGASITVGQLVTFLRYANQYMKPFNEISNVITELQNAVACANRVIELIEAEPEPAEPDDAADLTEIMNALPEGARGKIDIENVDFSYTKDKELIKGLNLSVSPGKRVAIVGPTGSGKSTLINLLMRFYDVDKGSIKTEDRDIRELTRESLRNSYGMVLQETWLKTASVRDNIAYGREDAPIEEIMQAARMTHADHFIKRLPNGYDTVLGEEGGSLSEGQKQLLCITRVMLNLPPMLILDEATSSIDTRTEHYVQDSFSKLMKGRTSFIVAHRLSTIKEADVILVIRDGNIVEQGNHEELINLGGFYKDLYMSQFETQ
ncbi:MAG: ABC transporter ATP-binding protein/permease [Eubacterium sp.]|nr:ABC transporter ATP-binding protein/permease [Eubacterium sp.]